MQLGEYEERKAGSVAMGNNQANKVEALSLEVRITVGGGNT